MGRVVGPVGEPAAQVAGPVEAAQHHRLLAPVARTAASSSGRPTLG